MPLPAGGMEEPHAHTWCVTADFRSERLAEPMGVVIDFVEADGALAAVVSGVDGTDLNAAPPFADRCPSAERVAEWIAAALAQRLGADGRLYCVTVTEAPGCRAAYYPGTVLDAGER